MSGACGIVEPVARLRHRPHHAPRFLTAQPGDAAVTTLPLRGFRQTRDYTCGFAATLMVMHYFGAQVPATELLRRLGTDRAGTRQNAIVRELRAAGLRAGVRYDLDLARIGRAIERNKLVIGYLHDIEHWVVVYGHGREPERVYVADPRPEVDACAQPWSEYAPRLRGFGILCSRPGQSQVPARQAALALAGEPAPLPPRRAGRLQCRVYGFVEGPPPIPAAPAQLALPLG